MCVLLIYSILYNKPYRYVIIAIARVCVYMYIHTCMLMYTCVCIIVWEGQWIWLIFHMQIVHIKPKVNKMVQESLT